MQEKMYKALEAKYDAEYRLAEVTLSIYMSRPVAIGEHPQHLEEMDKLVNAMVNASDNKKMIKRWYTQNHPNQHSQHMRFVINHDE